MTCRNECTRDGHAQWAQGDTDGAEAEVLDNQGEVTGEEHHSLLHHL